jgi:hypothetical protein
MSEVTGLMSFQTSYLTALNYNTHNKNETPMYPSLKQHHRHTDNAP